MKAKRVYEFKRGRDIKKSLGVGIPIMGYQGNWQATGGCAIQHYIQTTPRRLLDLAKSLGSMYYEDNTGEDKVNFEFAFQTREGEYFTLYDYKEYEPLDMDKEYDWHIGTNTMDCDRAFEIMKEVLGI